jgi:hypothetical protein
MKPQTVNVIMLKLPSNGNNDIRDVARSHGRPVLDSGNYRHGFAVTERMTMEPGTYAMIVSTFHPGKLGSYGIKIAHSSKSGVEISRLQ